MNLSEQDNSWASIPHFCCFWSCERVKKQYQMSKLVSQYRINTWHFVRLICYWHFLFLRKKNTCRQFNRCRTSLRVIWNRWDGWRRRQNAWTHDHKPIQAVNYMSQLLWLSLLHELNLKKTDQITHSSYLYPLLHINSWAHWIWTDTCCQSSSKRTLCFWLSRPIFCVKWFVCVTNSHWISEWIQNKMDYVEKNPIIEQVDAFKLPLIRAHIDYLIDWRLTVIFANAWQMW